MYGVLASDPLICILPFSPISIFSLTIDSLVIANSVAREPKLAPKEPHTPSSSGDPGAMPILLLFSSISLAV